MTAEQTLLIPGRPDSPERRVELRRPYTPTSSPLRAWSAADELVLADLAAVDPAALLIVNDEFGALSCGFSDHCPIVWVDSALSRDAIETNLKANGLEPAGDRLVAGNLSPAGPFDLVVVRLPKSTALLEWQLGQIAAVIEPGTPVVGLGMARHISRSTREAFAQIIGPSDVSRATRKARLIHAQRNDAVPGEVQPSAPFSLDDGTVVAQRPGVFSAGHIDAGTAVLLEHVQAGSADRVLDLGCGNGVIAASLARRDPVAHFTLLDVSNLAIEAAQETWTANGLEADRATMIVADGAYDVADDSIDLVVSNPPFHQGHAVDELLAERLLADAARVLTQNGRLLAVGQRDLHLHTRLRRMFSHVQVVSKHPMFVVVEAIDPT